MTDTFPRQYARTQRFTLGEPRNVTVSPDGERVVFLRSRGRRRSGQLPVGARRRRPATSGWSPIRVDAARRRDDADDDLPPEERARRERMREGAGGITAFATDRAVTGRRVRARPAGCSSPACSAARHASSPVDGPVFDPRPDPLAQRVAYVSGSRAAHRRARRQQLGARRRDRPRRHVGQRRLHRRRGDAPLPRATGGVPDGTAIAVVPRRHRHRCSSGTSPTRPIPTHAANRASLPGGRHDQRRRRRCTCSALDGRQRRGRVGPPTRTRTSPTSRGSTSERLLRHGAVARPDGR